MNRIVIFVIMLAGSVFAGAPAGEQYNVIYLDGTFEEAGVLYQLSHISSNVSLPPYYMAGAIQFTGGVAKFPSKGAMINGKYEFGGGVNLLAMAGHAKSVHIPAGMVNFVLGSDRNYQGRFFWGVTNVEEVVFNKSIIVYPETSDYYSFDRSTECSLFRGCRGLKRAVMGKAPLFTQRDNQYVLAEEAIRAIAYNVKELYYPQEYAQDWESALSGCACTCKYGAYTGEWASVECVIPGSGNLKLQEPLTVTNYVYTTVSITNYVNTTVTNEVYHHDVVTNVVEQFTTVTNVVRYVPEPGTSPAPAYHINAGASGDLQIAGAAGWDAYGIPDGMTWDQKNGVLSGAANKSGVYDLLLVSGSGTETKIMRTTLEVKGYAAIVGHVGVAFSKSGAPVNCLKSYKTLPAGLKWDAKTKILSGIPTKAQTLSYETVYGDPVTIEIKPAETTMAGTYNGMIGYRVEEGEGDPWHAIGNLTVTAAATGKLSAKVVVPQGTFSFSASAWDSVSDGIYRVDMSTKAGDTLCIVLDTTKDWKEDRLIAPSSFKIAKDENSYVAAGWRNEHGKTDAIAKDPVASEFISRIKALKKMYLKATKVDDDHYTLEAQTAAKGADVTLTFNANGTVAYSGKVGGTKASGTSTLAVDGDSYYTIFDLVVPVSKTRAMHFAMGFDKGPSSTPIPDFEVAVSDVL